MIVVVSNPRDWTLKIPDVQVVKADDYLSDEQYSGAKGLKLFNLCRTYSYQSTGYYVSLLAAARGHTAIPSLQTILDMKARSIIRLVDDELDSQIQSSLASIKSSPFELSIYFGRNMARRHEALARKLFNLFPTPFIRASFLREKDRWRLQRLDPIQVGDIPEGHFPFVLESAATYFAKPRFSASPRKHARYHLAILHDPDDPMPPSNSGAIKKFVKAAEKVDFGVELVRREDYSRLPEFDALFIRETTAVNHHTFRFAQRAQAEGLAVIDDPQSILRCSNKVFMAETLQRNRIPVPKTIITGSPKVQPIIDQIGLPCVLKYPDSAFSQGVLKAKTPDELHDKVAHILEESDLFVAQEFVPTAFDWRVGLMDGRVLYACRYHMAGSHWQIVQKVGEKNFEYGKVEPVALEDAPPVVLDIAKKAADLFGRGLYGVDLKEVAGRCVVMEINDNPNIDSGFEDHFLKDELYGRIMRGLLARVETIKGTR